MANASEDAPESGPGILFGLLGFWAIYLVFAAVAAIATGDALVFVTVGFFIPGILVAALAFAGISVGLFLLAIRAASELALRTIGRAGWDLSRLYSRAALLLEKGGREAGDRRMSAWGFLVDAVTGLIAGIGFGVVVCAPFVAVTVLGGHPPSAMVGWLPVFGGIMMATGAAGSIVGVSSRGASVRLLAMAKRKAAILPPPVDDEFF